MRKYLYEGTTEHIYSHGTALPWLPCVMQQNVLRGKEWHMAVCASSRDLVLKLMIKYF